VGKSLRARAAGWAAALLFLLPLRPVLPPAALGAQPPLPAPVGYVNDFAGVMSAESRARLEGLSTRVHELTRGDMVIVTMADLGGRPPEEVALRLGRTWKVGADAGIGDSARNAGVVILVVPKEASSDGRGHCRIEVGQGAEGFLTDATAGSLCRAVIPLFQQRDYAGAIEQLGASVAQRYARAFGVNLDGTPAPRRAARDSGGEFPMVVLLFIVVFLVIAIAGGRRRRGSVASDVGTAIAINVLSEVLRGSRGSRGGWGGDGWGGGGGGGGFGGFGGGGGFSGGGGGSSW